MRVALVSVSIFLGLASGGAASAQQRALINNAQSPHARLKSIGLDDCRWTEGFWFDKQKLCTQVMVQNLGRLMDDPEIIHATANFRVAAGLEEGEFRGWSFTDGDYYKYVEAMAAAFELTGDPELDRSMDAAIGLIGQAQLENGYLHTPTQIGHGINGFRHATAERRFDSAPGPFTSGGRHEFYNFGHLMTAACVHHRVTGKTAFLDIAKKSADLLVDRFSVPPENFAQLDWNPPHYMGLVELYRTTGDRRYLDLAETLVDVRGTGKLQATSFKGPDHSQNRTPVRKEAQVLGHAGHGNYLYAGAADVVAETGDPTLLAALERLWTDLTTTKMYVHGGAGMDHFGLTANKDKVSESYGQSFDLPSVSMYAETCANIGNAMWSWRMFLLNGEARFMDVAELAFYNSSLSGISLDGKHFFYTNPLAFLRGHPHNSKDGGERADFLSVFCCPPNIIRTVAEMQAYAYTTSDRAVWVNLYGSNDLVTDLPDGTQVSLRQRTDYPWDGRVTITVDGPEDTAFSLMLRIPGWSQGGTLTVGGEAVDADLTPGRYVAVERTWSAGDEVVLDLPMTPRLIGAHPFVDGLRGQAAVKRGPLVYCLESVDLPEGVAVTDVVLPRGAELTARFDPDLLSGVTVLEGEARGVPRADGSGGLYAPLPSEPARSVPVRLIPYFAWANRGPVDMTVWMPLDHGE